MNRQEIKSKIEDNLKAINALEESTIELLKEYHLLSDDVQRFEEKVEYYHHTDKRRKPHPYDGKLIGRIYWTEIFVDEDEEEGDKEIKVDRNMVVRIDGQWVAGALEL